MKYLSIDVETTGCNPDRNKVIMFAAILDDLSDPKPIDDLPFYCCFINQDCIGDPEALKMNEWIFRMMHSEGISQAQFLKEFEKFLLDNGFETDRNKIRFTVAGKNVAGFDRLFLNNIPGFTDRFYIHHRCIDPALLYLQEGDETLPDLQLCLQRAGIVKQIAHNALEDALDVVRLVRGRLPAVMKSTPVLACDSD